MSIATPTPVPDVAVPAAVPVEGLTQADAATDPAIDDEILLEEISIDGMCGVY